MFGSMTTPVRSLPESPVEMPVDPQWYGTPIWWTTVPPHAHRPHPLGHQHPGLDRRAPVTIVAQPPLLQPPLLGQLRADLDEELRLQLRQVRQRRLIPPAVWCSVSR